MPLQAQLAHHNRVGRAGGAGGVVAAAVQHLVGQNRKGNGLLGVAVQAQGLVGHHFSFLVVGLGCMCYGPCVGMMAGAIIDSVGFLLSSYGEPYFPGYLVTAVLSGFLYGVLLYKRKPTLLRIIVVRLIINYGSNVLLGSVWKAMLYGKGYLYSLTSGAIKNTLMLPVEVFLMWAVLNAAVNYGLDRKYIHKR